MIRAILLLAGLAGAQVAAAQGTEPGGALRIELNNAATLDGGSCQLTYVAVNETDRALDQLAYQAAFFDGTGVVRRLLVLEFGALTPGQTRVVLFNLPDLPCEDVSRILVNDLARCDVAGGEPSVMCLTALDAASRTDIQFGL
ncbi:hypothetical protein [Jannaschia sp. LMIT008]|uniref:hypothetical protein n=1 Tax=Jannaschia maritima TaxID=3032585 RepID=UPI0028118802|nr:hypothetical protein [Jannaschia sp. LMIT008]